MSLGQTLKGLLNIWQAYLSHHQTFWNLAGLLLLVGPVLGTGMTIARTSPSSLATYPRYRRSPLIGYRSLTVETRTGVPKGILKQVGTEPNEQ